MRQASGEFGDGGRSRPGRRASTAVANPRDAYSEVPILRQPTWGHDVAAYFYLGGISSGALVIGSLAQLVGGEERRELARTAHLVAFGMMLPCAPLLIEDLGMPKRFHHMLRVFKPSSPMNLGSWTLVTHGAFATLMTLRALADSDKVPLAGSLLMAVPETPIAAASIVPALTLGGYTGVLIGTTSVPVWSTSSLLGGLFMASALATGTAAVSLASILSGRDSRADLAALGALSLVLGTADLALTGGYLATSGAAAKPLFRGVEKVLMIGAAGVSGAALIFEATGMASPSHRRLFSGLAAGATLTGGALLRWAIVRAGRASANDREGTLEATEPSEDAPGWGSRLLG